MTWTMWSGMKIWAGDREQSVTVLMDRRVCSEGKRNQGWLLHFGPDLFGRMMAFPLTKANIQCLSHKKCLIAIEHVELIGEILFGTRNSSEENKGWKLPQLGEIRVVHTSFNIIWLNWRRWLYYYNWVFNDVSDRKSGYMYSELATGNEVMGSP